jgi:hypothetical protein
VQLIRANAVKLISSISIVLALTVTGAVTILLTLALETGADR